MRFHILPLCEKTQQHLFHSLHLQNLLELQQICGSEGQPEELQVRFLPEWSLRVTRASGRGVQGSWVLHQLEESHRWILWWVSHPSPHVFWIFVVCLYVSWSLFLLLSGVTCPKGLVYDECRDRLDDYCYGGSVTSAQVVLDIFVTHYLIIFLFPFPCWRLLHPAPPLDSKSSGCFCPSGQFREGNQSHTCVSRCPCEYPSNILSTSLTSLEGRWLDEISDVNGYRLALVVSWNVTHQSAWISLNWGGKTVD